MFFLFFFGHSGTVVVIIVVVWSFDGLGYLLAGLWWLLLFSTGFRFMVSSGQVSSVGSR